MVYHPLIDNFHYLKENVYKNFLHEHDGYEIFYIHSGSCNYYFDSDYVTLLAGDLFLVRSNVLHGPSMNNICVRTCLWFTEPCIQSIGLESMLVDIMKPYRKLKPSCKISLQQEEKKDFEDLLLRMNRAHQRNDAVSIERFRLAFFELLLQIYQYYQEKPIDRYNVSEKNEVYVSQILTFINEQFNQDISFDDLAKVTHLSKSHLMKVFKETLGISISEYINRRRVYEAKKLLITLHHLSVTEIAFTVGYKQLSHFSACFKKITGYSPEKFRRTTVLA